MATAQRWRRRYDNRETEVAGPGRGTANRCGRLAAPLSLHQFRPSALFRPAALLRPPAPVEAVLWMVLSTGIFAAGNVLIRHATTEIHPFEVVFFRNLFSLLFMLPLLLAVGISQLRTDRLSLYGVRACTTLGAMLTWFYGVSVLPLPDATALSFTTPLFATIGAALVLKEVVRLRRWTAIAIGFVGVLIILRPGAGTLSADALVVLASCVFSAATMIQIRTLARSEGVTAMVTYMALFLTPLSLVPALAVWTWPSWGMVGWLALLGGVLTLGHLTLTRAFHMAEASALAPYDYVKLPLTAVLAYALYGEVMDVWGWAGAAVIAGSTLYIANRETAVARSRRVTVARAAETPLSE